MLRLSAKFKKTNFFRNFENMISLVCRLHTATPHPRAVSQNFGFRNLIMYLNGVWFVRNCPSGQKLESALKVERCYSTDCIFLRFYKSGNWSLKVSSKSRCRCFGKLSTSRIRKIFFLKKFKISIFLLFSPNKVHAKTAVFSSIFKPYVLSNTSCWRCLILLRLKNCRTDTVDNKLILDFFKKIQTLRS